MAEEGTSRALLSHPSFKAYSLTFGQIGVGINNKYVCLDTAWTLIYNQLNRGNPQAAFETGTRLSVAQRATEDTRCGRISEKNARKPQNKGITRRLPRRCSPADQHGRAPPRTRSKVAHERSTSTLHRMLSTPHRFAESQAISWPLPSGWFTHGRAGKVCVSWNSERKEVTGKWFK